MSDEAMTPRERLHLLREQEALRDTATIAPATTAPAPATVTLTPVADLPKRRGKNRPAEQPTTEQWTVDATGIQGGTFTWRDLTVDLTPDQVVCAGGQHAQIVAEYIAKMRADIGLTRPPSSMRQWQRGQGG